MAAPKKRTDETLRQVLTDPSVVPEIDSQVTNATIGTTSVDGRLNWLIAQQLGDRVAAAELRTVMQAATTGAALTPRTQNILKQFFVDPGAYTDFINNI